MINSPLFTELTNQRCCRLRYGTRYCTMLLLDGKALTQTPSKAAEKSAGNGMR